jgi:hypothetical protein
VIRVDGKVIHAVAQVRNHAIPFPFAHQAFLESVLPILHRAYRRQSAV